MDQFNKLYNQDKATNSNSADDKNRVSRTKCIYIGNVISIIDENDARRVKVRIPELDNNIDDSELVYCYPLLPIHTNVPPRVGEPITIIVSDIAYPYNDRFYISSVIPQYQNITKQSNREGGSFVGVSHFFEKIIKSFTSISKKATAKNLYPKMDDVTINGRNNADIVFSDREIKIRAGKATIDDNTVENTKNPSYIILKLNDDGSQSSINLVADKINLITHDGVPNTKPIVDSTELNKFIENAHPIAFGDELKDFLELFRQAFIQHIHPYHGKEQINKQVTKDLMSYDLTKIHSKNSKIN